MITKEQSAVEIVKAELTFIKEKLSKLHEANKQGVPWALESIAEFLKIDLHMCVLALDTAIQSAENVEDEIEDIKSEYETKIQDMMDFTEPCPHCRVSGCICP